MSSFITFEGGEGSGKSTQAEILARRLQQAGVPSLLVHEPGTTSLGWYLRDWLKQEKRREESVSHRAELLLFAAARAEFVARVLRPAMQAENKVVVADRYADSTTAYQGYGRRLSLEDVAYVNRIATQGVMPDITFLLDCSPLESLKRLGSVQASFPLEQGEDTPQGRFDREGSRRFEEESLDFHRRVREGYLKIAEQEPVRWRVIDATRDAQDIGEEVWEQVQAQLSPPGGGVPGDVGANLPLWTDAVDT